MTAADSSRSHRFGRFELQLDERRLLDAGQPVRIGRHAFDLLTALVERSGHLITKDALLERVWPKLVVEENTLQAHVSALRKILGAEAIATISGQGYRFTLEVLARDEPTLSARVSRTHNLPIDATSFVGREDVADQLRVLLDRTRLLTLTGAGGCGKTRLAVRVAADHASAFADGVWFVELAALQDPSLLIKAVANVLEVPETAGKSLTVALTDALGPRRLLLVLDNAEHVLGACARLVDEALRACARIVVLVTSRERLGVAGELTYRVPSLSVPDPTQQVTPEGIVGYESVRLFVDRARLQRPHFAVTTENAAALASICHRLDGIPLAIELAAGRVRSMSVEEVSRRLEQTFGLLAAGSRAALPRHRTLRSLIDWSYDLLSAAEKALLCRTSVFAGGWTLDAAEQVCVAPGADATGVLDLLASLVDKNLAFTKDDRGAIRYGLLETVRHYARDQLAESGEQARTERLHLECFVALAEEAEPQLVGAEQQAWVERVQTEHDNLRSALAWSAGNGGDPAGGLRLAGSIWWFWYARGYLAEGFRWLSGALSVEPGEQSAPARAKALRGAGVLAFQQGDYPAAWRLHEEGLVIHLALGDERGVVRSLNNMGMVAFDRTDYSAARALYEEALKLQRTFADRGPVGVMLNNLGAAVNEQGDPAAARAHFEEGLVIQRELGDRRCAAVLLTNLGNIACQQGDYSRARALLEESLAIRHELGDTVGAAAYTLIDLGNVFHCQGEDVAAQALFMESLAVQRGLGDRRHAAESLDGFAAVISALYGPRPAARVWGAAERFRESTGASLPPSARRGYARDVAAARAMPGDDAGFERAWQDGRAMTLEQAMAYAIEGVAAATTDPSRLHAAPFSEAR